MRRRLREEVEHELAELDVEAELGLVDEDEYELRRAELEAWLYALEERRRKKRRKGKRA
mgnify:CR=1 FL=1